MPEAEASPLGFRRPRATFAIGLDVSDALTGDFGKASAIGMSLFAEATLQVGGYFGANVRFGSARAFTHKDFLPFDEGYQYIYFIFSPRFNLAPFRRVNLNFYLQPDIGMQVLVSNTLVTMTGNKQVTGMAGGALGFQYLYGLLSVSGQVDCRYNWDLSSVFVGGSVSIGISSTL